MLYTLVTVEFFCCCSLRCAFLYGHANCTHVDTKEDDQKKKWQFQASQAFSLKTCAINRYLCHTENRMTECWLVEIGLSKFLSVVLSPAQSNALFSIFPFNCFSSLWLLVGVLPLTKFYLWCQDFTHCSVHWEVLLLHALICIFPCTLCLYLFLTFCGIWLCLHRLEPCGSAEARSSLEASGPGWSWINQRGRMMAQLQEFSISHVEWNMVCHATV